MKIVKKIIQFLLMLILCSTVILLIFINLANSTIFNKEYILEKLAQTNYYAKIDEEITNEFENYILQSGLDESVLQGIVTQEKIEQDTKIIIDNIYEGTKTEISTTEIEENIKNNIRNTMDKELTATQQKTVNQYIEKIEEQYLNVMSHTKYEEKIHNIFIKIQEYLELGKKASIIAIAVVSLILIISNYKEILRAIPQFGSVILATGIFCTFINIFTNYKININNILILNSAISEALKSILQEILSKLQNAGYISIGVGILVIILGSLINTYIYKKDIEEEQIQRS